MFKTLIFTLAICLLLATGAVAGERYRVYNNKGQYQGYVEKGENRSYIRDKQGRTTGHIDRNRSYMGDRHRDSGYVEHDEDSDERENER